MLKAAKKALDTLDSSILAEIKTVKKNPPPLTECIMYGVSIIIRNGAIPKDWGEVMKKVMNMEMKKNMQKVSPESFPDKAYKRLQKHLSKYNGKNFQEDIAKQKKKSALYIIGMWVWSLYETHDICKEVAEKKEMCAQLTIGLQGKEKAV